MSIGRNCPDKGERARGERVQLLDRRRFLLLAAAGGFLLAQSSSASMCATTDLDLTGLESRYGGRLGLCAQAGSQRVAWRADERFAYCSTFKLFLAACVLCRVQDGQERLHRALPIRESEMVAHAPITGPAVGSTLTVAELCKAAVELSDNPAANILLRELGGLEAFEAWYRGIGDAVTRVDRYETDLNSALPGDPRDTTTPAQSVANLDRVILRGLLEPKLMQLLRTWLLETPTGQGRIKAAVPDEHLVAHKTGTGPQNTCNNIGVVWTPSGPPVAIAVYYTGAGKGTPGQLDAVVADAVRAAMRRLATTS